MAPYVLADNPTFTAREALRESKRITQGHKGQLFVLELSFFGWMLLACIPIVGTIVMLVYVIPYMSATYANAYNALKASANTNTVEF